MKKKSGKRIDERKNCDKKIISYYITLAFANILDTAYPHREQYTNNSRVAPVLRN